MGVFTLIFPGWVILLCTLWLWVEAMIWFWVYQFRRFGWSEILTMKLVILAMVGVILFGCCCWFIFLEFLISWNCEHEGTNGDIIEVLERFQGFDDCRHGGSLLRPVAQALVSQCSRLSSPGFRVLTFQSRIHYPAKFPGIIQHRPRPFYQVLFPWRTALLYWSPPC